MQRLWKWIGLVIVSTILCTNGYAENILRLTNGEFAPYLSKDLKYYGVASRIVSEAFALEGITVQYTFFPWKRAFEAARDAEYDGSVVWSHSEERAKDFYYSDSVIEGNTVFFHLKSYAFDWKTVQDLEKLNIGGTIGYSYGDEFDQAEKARKLKVELVPKDEQNFKKLVTGRIQIVPLELEVGYSLLPKHLPPAEVQLITHHPRTLKSIPYHLILSKKIEKNQQLISLFNKGLKRLHTSGKFEQFVTESRSGL